MASVSRSVVEAFYKAYPPRDTSNLGSFLADNVQWIITGPVELLQFCGHWRGKRAVIELYDHLVPQIFRVTNFKLQALLVDGDRASAMGRLSAVLPNGRSISYDLAHFLRFHDDKVVEFRALIDSFNAAEQVTGREIELTADTERQRLAVVSDVVAI